MLFFFHHHLIQRFRQFRFFRQGDRGSHKKRVIHLRNVAAVKAGDVVLFFVVALGAALLLPSRFVWFFVSVSVVAVF